MTETSLPHTPPGYGPLLVESVPIPLAVAAGGFFFPLVAVWVGSLWLLGSSLVLGRNIDLYAAGTAFLVGNAVAVVVGIVVFFPLLLLAMAVWAAARLMLATLQSQWTDTQLGCHVGAWTALLATIFTVLYVSHPGRSHDLVHMYLLAGLATPLGQYAGAWSRWPAFEAQASSRSWRFGIRQVLVLTLWLAIGLTVLKASGLAHGVVIVFLTVWLIYQWCTMKLVFWFCQWRSRKRWGCLTNWDGGDLAGERSGYYGT